MKKTVSIALSTEDLGGRITKAAEPAKHVSSQHNQHVSGECDKPQNCQPGARVVLRFWSLQSKDFRNAHCLKWRCIHDDSITIEERYCRGDWSVPKTDASAATIGVEKQVIARLLRLKDLTVEVRAGRAVRKYKVVKSAAPDDLVFQSVKGGHPMNDQNILKRHVQPGAEKLGLPFVNWRCLRTSHATWLVQAGADPKSVQGQMRHSRISTTMDVYAQIVPAAQRRALQQLSRFALRSNSVQ